MAIKKAAKKPVKRAATARRSTNVPEPRGQGSFDNVDQGQPQQGAPYNQGRSNFNGGGNRPGASNRGGKPSAFTSVTGLWPGKKANTIGSGKCKNEQIEKVIAVLTEALEKGVEVRFSVFAPGQYTHAQAMGDLAISLVDPNYQSGGGRSAGRSYPQRNAAPAPRGNFRPQQNQGWEQEAPDNDGQDVNFG